MFGRAAVMLGIGPHSSLSLSFCDTIHNGEKRYMLVLVAFYSLPCCRDSAELGVNNASDVRNAGKRSRCDDKNETSASKLSLLSCFMWPAVPVRSFSHIPTAGDRRLDHSLHLRES